MKTLTQRLSNPRLLDLVPVVLMLLVAVFFSAATDSFATWANVKNILLQSSHLAILALGASLVLLVAGVDLSVGATMYVAAALIGVFMPGAPVLIWLLAGCGIGLVLGAINAFFVVRVRVAAFIVTLSMLFLLRGVGLWISDTKMVFAAPHLLEMSRASFLGIPVPILLAGLSLVFVHLLLSGTPFGRSVYAIGDDPEGARRAGIPVERVTFMLFVLCGGFAGLSGVVLMSQIAAASSTFGQEKEFMAIAAAVLGGTSLFGGRGNAFGPVFGAILMQTVQNGLVLMDTDPYLYPLITGAVIFIVVLIDTLRNQLSERLGRSPIRVEA
ncbi:ribose transport system permease protein [Aliiruegeria haliotis]|uniref:Ribose transport system permease protein n=1 Tax=Aliiruegeria haliotis TaxID=1280846 RepID=A0A2T0RLW5_9RHOB|nr:ABC transporter permease [Aliiruegeria haliotis]PRY22112.1 ribose transport system permease protein [Aliiruegeria haliotis]